MIVTAKIIGYDGKNMVVIPDASIDKELIQKQINRVEIRLNDGRTITAEQRKKAYATIRDISDYSGHAPEFLKEWFKYEYIIKTGGKMETTKNRYGETVSYKRYRLAGTALSDTKQRDMM